MRSRWSYAALAVGLIALTTGLVVWLRRPPPAGPPVLNVDVRPEPTPDTAPPRYTEWQDSTEGGTYGGRVLDEETGKPVRDADVLLVAIDGDAKVTVDTVDAQGNADPMDIPVFGDFRTAARTRTDADGSFTVAAGNARVVALVAYERAHAPGLLAHTKQQPLAPGPDHVVKISAAGWLKGHVEDAVTKKGIAGADVGIYFQSMANQDRAGPTPFSASNSFARFQTYVARTLGPMVWGIQAPQGDNGFHVGTDANGTFVFGPIMKEVQVWFIVSHPDYMWTEDDPDVFLPGDVRDGKPVARKQRMMIPPGKTVERTFSLVKGKEIAGTVVDGEGKPLDGVQIFLDHVAQYYQHPWYRDHSRNTRTDAKGRFRVAGLSYPPYNLRLVHPAFDTEYVSGVQEGSDVLYKFDVAGGWATVTVEGGPVSTERPTFAARAVLEPAERKGARREQTVTVRDGTFELDKIKPGRYDLFVVTGTKISDTARIEVSGSNGVKALVRLQEGGGVRVPVRSSDGQAVDPASVELDVISAEGAIQRRAALLVSRAGLASADSLLSGRYRARAKAPGYVSAQSDEFDVGIGSTTTLPAIVLQRQGYLRVTVGTPEDGRPITGDLTMSVAQGGGEFVPVKTLQAGLLPVLPGSVMLKVESSDGRSFRQTVDVAEGQTLPVEIKLAR